MEFNSFSELQQYVRGHPGENGLYAVKINEEDEFGYTEYYQSLSNELIKRFTIYLNGETKYHFGKFTFVAGESLSINRVKDDVEVKIITIT